MENKKVDYLIFSCHVRQ